VHINSNRGTGGQQSFESSLDLVRGIEDGASNNLYEASMRRTLSHSPKVAMSKRILKTTFETGY